MELWMICLFTIALLIVGAWRFRLANYRLQKCIDHGHCKVVFVSMPCKTIFETTPPKHKTVPMQTDISEDLSVYQKFQVKHEFRLYGAGLDLYASLDKGLKNPETN